jgi:hypothetical protein
LYGLIGTAVPASPRQDKPDVLVRPLRSALAH